MVLRERFEAHRQPVSLLLGGLIGVLGAAFVLRGAWREWGHVHTAISVEQLPWALAAFVVAALGITGIGMAWRRALALLGIHVSTTRALLWYFVGQLGKYAPGGIWAVVGRGELATREGQGRARAYGAVAVSMAGTWFAAAIALATIAPFTPDFPTIAAAIVGATVIALGLLFIHPSVIHLLLRLLRRYIPATPALVIPPWPWSLKFLALHLPSWGAIGLATYLVSVAVGAAAPLPAVAAAAIASWIIGFVVVPVPGGLGVREASFALLASWVTDGPWATVAIVARVLFMLVDLGGAGTMVLLRTIIPASLRQSPLDDWDG